MKFLVHRILSSLTKLFLVPRVHHVVLSTLFREGFKHLPQDYWIIGSILWPLWDPPNKIFMRNTVFGPSYGETWTPTASSTVVGPKFPGKIYYLPLRKPGTRFLRRDRLIPSGKGFRGPNPLGDFNASVGGQRVDPMDPPLILGLFGLLFPDPSISPAKYNDPVLHCARASLRRAFSTRASASSSFGEDGPRAPLILQITTLNPGFSRILALKFLTCNSRNY